MRVNTTRLDLQRTSVIIFRSSYQVEPLQMERSEKEKGRKGKTDETVNSVYYVEGQRCHRKKGRVKCERGCLLGAFYAEDSLSELLLCGDVFSSEVTITE